MKRILCGILLCCLCMGMCGCFFGGKTWKAREKDGPYVYYNGVAYERMDELEPFLRPIEIGDEFARFMEYDSDENVLLRWINAQEHVYYEVEGEDPNEWFYMEYSAVMLEIGVLMKRADIETPTLETFGANEVFIFGYDAEPGEGEICRIADREVISRLLQATKEEPAADFSGELTDVAMVEFRSSQYPGLQLGWFLAQDALGEGYLSQEYNALHPVGDALAGYLPVA